MKRLFAIAAILIPIYLFAQGFGSFSHDQPFFAQNVTASASGGFPIPTNGVVVAIWDASVSGTNDGDLITTLLDTWTNSYHLVATNGTTDRPLWTNNVSAINNKGYLRFNKDAVANANTMRTNITTAYNQPNVFFIVAKDVNIPYAIDDRIFCASDANAYLWGYSLSGGGTYHWYSGNTFDYTSANSPPDASTWQIYILRQNGASSSVKAGSWAGVTGNTGSANGKGMVLAAGFNSDFHAQVDIAYLLWFNGNMSGYDETNMVRYIVNSYGVPSNYGP